MKITKTGYFAGGGILLAIIVFFLFAGGDSSLKIEVHKGPLLIDLDVTGELVARKSITVSSPDVRIQLRVTYLIKDGAVVKKGDVLVRFDPSELQKELTQSEADLKTIEAQIDQKQASLEAMRRKYKLQLEDVRMALEMAKLDMVNDEGLLPAKEVAKAKLKLENARAKYEETEKELKDEEEASLADLRVMTVKRKNQTRKVQFARDSIAKMTLKAPDAGLVVINEIWKGNGRAKVQEGDSVWRGYPIITLPDLSTLQVKAWVSEVDVGKLKTNIPAKVVLDAFPGESFPGKVKKISSVGAKRSWNSDKKEFETIVGLNKLDKRMKPGMTVRATLTIKAFANIISIPIEALFTNEDGKEIVYIRRHGGRKAVIVETGERNATHIQIKKGIEEGDVIYLEKDSKSK